MNLNNILANAEKTVAAKNVLKDKGAATLLQIKKGAELKEHQSMTNALLVLLSGKAVYEEKDRKVELSERLDFVRIPAKVSHKVSGVEDALLLLVQ